MPRKKKEAPVEEPAGRRESGTGSITQRKDGLWVARLDLGRDENGKRIVWQKAGKDKKEVLKELNAQVQRRQRGLDIGTANQLLSDFLDTWLESAVRPKAAKTYTSYKQLITVHINPSIGRYKLCDLHPQHIQNMLDRLVCHDGEGNPTDRPVSPRTREYVRAILRAALGRAVRWRILDHNPAQMVDVAKPPKRPVTMLSIEDAQKVLGVIAGHPLEALYTVALACGLRESEALGLRWEDVDLDAHQITVRVALEQSEGKWQLKDLKDHRRGKTIALPRFAADALKKRREIQRDQRIKMGFGWKNQMNLVFTTSAGTNLYPRNVYRQWQMFLAKANLPSMRFYDLRHTCASMLAAQGVPMEKIKEILGHSTILLTVDTYMHVAPADREGANVMDGLFRIG